jgi:phosphatidate phosphatase APP1
MAETSFPRGTLALRAFRPKDSSRWNLLQSPRRHKLAAISALLRRYPQRHFILIGDSGESDPEIYGELARAFPTQIQTIAIRRLPGDTYTPARSAAAFASVKARILTFESPSELPALADL